VYKTDPHRCEELRTNKGLEISTNYGNYLQKFNNNVFCRCTKCKQSRVKCRTCCNTGELLLCFLKVPVIGLLSSSRHRVSCFPRRGGRRSGGGDIEPALVGQVGRAQPVLFRYISGSHHSSSIFYCLFDPPPITVPSSVSRPLFRRSVRVEG
jgi:hypothetical protein